MIHKGIVATNRKAKFLYFLEKAFEAGIVLAGDEVKSLRMGACDLKGSYVEIRDGEVFLIDTYIRPYPGAREPSKPRRPRKLLLSKRQIHRLIIKLNQGGFTCVPLEMLFNEKGIAKVRIALAKGRKQYDHKDQILERTRNQETRNAKRTAEL